MASGQKRQMVMVAAADGLLSLTTTEKTPPAKRLRRPRRKLLQTELCLSSRICVAGCRGCYIRYTTTFPYWFEKRCDRYTRANIARLNICFFMEVALPMMLSSIEGVWAPAIRRTRMERCKKYVMSVRQVSKRWTYVWHLVIQFGLDLASNDAPSLFDMN